MDFSSSTTTESPACPLCQKSFNLFRSKNHCNLCNQDFCSSCRHKTNFLISQLNSKSACKVCAIVCLVPQLDSTQITKLPIKLSMGILKAYNLPKNQFLERKDIVLAIINKTKFTQDTIRLYRNNWNAIEKEIIVWKNLLPQISNALESGFKESGSGNGNVRVERNSNGNGNIGNTSTSGSNNQQNSSTEMPSFGLDGLSEMFNGLPFGNNNNNNNNNTNQTQQNTNYNHNTNNNTVNFNPIQDFFHGLNTTFNGNDNNQQQQAQYTPSTTQTNASYNTRPTTSNNTQSAAGNDLNQQNNTQPRPQPDSTNININRQMSHPSSSQNKETVNTKQILKDLIKSEDYEDKVKKLPVKQLKQILKENLINFEMILEKKELINKVNYLIHSTKQESIQNVTNNEIANPELEEHGLEDNFLSDENLCKICYENSINCVLLNCGHSIACVECGKELLKNLLPCPICRADISKVIRIYKS